MNPRLSKSIIWKSLGSANRTPDRTSFYRKNLYFQTLNLSGRLFLLFPLTGTVHLHLMWTMQVNQ